MHTDEYEISLSRELSVCKSTIQKIQKSLRNFENKYEQSTDEFIEGYQNKKYSAVNKDFLKWFNNFEALRRWEKRKSDFEEIFYRMKI